MEEITHKQIEDFMLMLLQMGLQEKEIFEIVAALDTKERMLAFLDKLSEKNWEMTPQEVYEAAGQTVNEFLMM